jgi:hypothetical protein
LTQIKEDKKYGTWMIWLLGAELMFHVIGFILTVVDDVLTWKKEK